MKYNLNDLNRLSNIKEDNDVKSLSNAIFPGTHCPLFGVAMTASYIEDIAILVIGTSECTYYNKVFSNHRQGGKDKVYSMALKEKNVVFGADKQVIEAAKYVKEVENPSGLMIVSTCVPELIGEDYDGIQDVVEEAIGIPTFVVKTEHYKCGSHIPGMERTLSSLIRAIKEPTLKDGVNILGHRSSGVEKTEMYELLKEKGIKINSIIPSKCKLDDITNAANVELNIVTDMIALNLAKNMESKYKIPYVFFDKHLNKEQILSNYIKIQEILDIDLSQYINNLINEYDDTFNEVRNILKGKKFIYANTPMMAFETAEFMVELGMIPTMIQIRELYDHDIKWKDKILEKGFDPYVTRIANIAPMRYVYDELDSEIYIGHENPMLLKSKGITQFVLDNHAQKIGFELPISVMKEFINKVGRV